MVSATHCCNTELYLPLVDFLQENKSIYCAVVETFCESMLPQICEALEVLTWDAEGEVLLGQLFKLFEFGNGSRMSDKNLLILEFKYLQNKKW